MAKNSKKEPAKQRVKVPTLPAETKTLTATEAKKVKGGLQQIQQTLNASSTNKIGGQAN